MADEDETARGSGLATKRESAVELLLGQVRNCHGLARSALAMSEPDRAAAKRFMQIARKAGRAVAPYLRDLDLRQRVVGAEPMSEEEWTQVWARQDFRRYDI